jgi:RNA polymerase sigma factor (sigma-70 family)
MDDPAFEAFYQSVQPALLASLLAFSGNAELASEAADEAFVRALVHWRRVRTMASPGGWVYRVAVNLVRYQARGRTRERAAVARWVSGRSSPAPTGPAEGFDTEMRELVARLPERQRLAVVLRYVADLPEADIARIMGITRSTVSVTLVKARANLRGQLVDASPSTKDRP